MHILKSLVRVFPHCGLTEYIHLDHGTHFTAQFKQEVIRMLNGRLKLHCPYGHQVSGKVECK